MYDVLFNKNLAPECCSDESNAKYDDTGSAIQLFYLVGQVSNPKLVGRTILLEKYSKYG